MSQQEVSGNQTVPTVSAAPEVVPPVQSTPSIPDSISQAFESQVGRVAVASLLDQQIISFLATTLTKSLRSVYSIIGGSERNVGEGSDETSSTGTWVDRWSEEISFGVELVYTLLSMLPLGVDGTPAMKALSVAWTTKPWWPSNIFEGTTDSAANNHWLSNRVDKTRLFSALLYGWLLLLEHVAKRMRSFSVAQGWKDDENVWKQRAYEFFRWIMIASKSLSFINYVSFLATGHYPNLLLRIAGLDMIATTDGPAQKPSQIMIESRKILWITMLGAASALAVTVDWQACRFYTYFYAKYIYNMLASKYSNIKKYLQRKHSTNEETGESEDTDNTTFQRLPTAALSMACATCKAYPSKTPYIANCGHHFCYVCIYSLAPRVMKTTPAKNTEGGASTSTEFDDSEKHCPECLTVLSSAVPWSLPSSQQHD